jgi:hypothetical protein
MHRLIARFVNGFCRAPITFIFELIAKCILTAQLLWLLYNCVTIAAKHFYYFN